MAVSKSDINEFSLKLYQLFSTNDARNFFISPFSISIALKLCLTGAKTETAKQLRELLCLDESQNYLTESESLLKHINKSLNDDKSTKINTANKAYVMKDYKVKEEFLKSVQKHFEATIESLDFKENTKAASVINSWVAEKTNDKIKDFMSADALNHLTRLVLVNAIYFKGLWEKKFNRKNTIKHDFFPPNQNNPIKVDMMRLFNVKMNLMLNPFGLNCAICDIPYKDSKVSMRVILPNENENIFDFEKKITSKTFADLFSSNQIMKRKMHIHFPKFLITYKAELSSALMKAGCSVPFSAGKADFSGIDDLNSLNISSVLHQAFVEVDEEGTEAAAATGVMVGVTSVGMEPPPYDFVCNRPFMFIIFENKANTILFIGKCINPI